MIGILVVIAVLVALWALLWQTRPRFAFALFLGLPVGWLFYRFVEGFFTGDFDDMPLWLPPLPLIIVSLFLLAYGAMLWFRAEDINKPPVDEGVEVE